MNSSRHTIDKMMMSVFHVIAIIAGFAGTMMSLFLVFKFQWASGGPIFWILKSIACSFAPIFLFAGIFSLIIGIQKNSVVAITLGAITALIFGIYLFRISGTVTPSKEFERVFNKSGILLSKSQERSTFLNSPFSFIPKSTKFVFKQNIAFSIIPETNRQLLSDLWLPSSEIKSTGIAFIYFHGSAWSISDKDVGTRPFFRHLASQGHVIMDVAHRLYPETDMTGMMHDVKRAIAWMKSNASTYHVNPDRIVVGGGSSGGQLAMLAAYLPNEIKLRPAELEHADLSVHAVISLYGPPDVKALYFHTGQNIPTKSQSPEGKTRQGEIPPFAKKMMGKNYHRFGMDKPSADIGSLRAILGCHPDECPDLYDFFSPITHVNENCPPTLFIQGEHDMFTPVEAARRLHKKLADSHVPSMLHVLPQTDHAFDLFFPKISPTARTAFYDVERFLALMN